MVDENSVDWEKMEQDAQTDDGLPGVQIITRNMLARRLVWDIVPCDEARKVADYLGLAATSEEVETMEHGESHLRTEAVKVLLPYINMMADLSAEGVAASMLLDEGDTFTKDSPEFKEVSSKMAAVIFMTTWGIVSELVDVDALHMPHFTATTYVSPPQEDES